MPINEEYLLQNNITREDYISRVYDLSLDSVVLINRTVSGEKQPKDVVGDITRNIEYLQHIVSQTYWTNEDLTPFTEAILAGQNYLDSLPQ